MWQQRARDVYHILSQAHCFFGLTFLLYTYPDPGLGYAAVSLLLTLHLLCLNLPPCYPSAADLVVSGSPSAVVSPFKLAPVSRWAAAAC